MNDPSNHVNLSELLPKWAAGQLTLKELKGYTDDELYAIAHTAYFFLMQGKNEEARTLFEGLVAIDPRNEYYYRALGVIFHKLGDEERAIRQFGYAIQVNAKSSVAYLNRAEVYISRADWRAAQTDLEKAMQYIGAKELQLGRKANALLTMVKKKSR